MNLQKELIKYQSGTAKRFKPKTQDYNKVEMTRQVFWLQSREEWNRIKKLPFGKDRRKEIVDWCLKQTPELCWRIEYGFMVNTEGSLIVKKDRDLQYLIKKSILKQINKVKFVSLFTNNKCSNNFLVLSDKYDCTGQLIKQGDDGK